MLIGCQSRWFVAGGRRVGGPCAQQGQSDMEGEEPHAGFRGLRRQSVRCERWGNLFIVHLALAGG